jgi:UDP-N-acetylmuramoyl-L-alanyl-D-glutamate--2,6-diaminopimelate ligase
MELREIAAAVPDAEIRGDPSIEVVDLAYDSRDARPGTLFFCRAGGRHDGHDFAIEAIRGGAGALVVERWLPPGVPQVRVPSVRRAMGPAAATFFGHPSRGMTLAGVTGTNGKTTTTFMLERCFAAAGMKSGLMGTVETHVAGDILPVTRTTPEAVDFQRVLAVMRERGVAAAAVEVSSHGLELGRVEGSRFSCAIFTNLTQDHLDFHGTMEAYFTAKALLFTPALSDVAVINADDPSGVRLAGRTALPVVTYSVGAEADVRAVAALVGRSSSVFSCDAAGRRVEVHVPLAGRFNVSNALAAMAACHALGIDLRAAAEGIASLPGVPGRFESVDAGQEFTVLVDYAHTPDSVERALSAAREICAGRLVVVLGCGGDRDRSKRPLMGRAATALADRAFLTSDNPRSEDPLAILAEIEAGAASSGGSYVVEPDRRLAIRSALRDARAGDVIVIAGKGHESGQEFADRTVPFDDRVVAREELEAMR